MPLFDAILLGALQGFTEFLPVSSSGHLALAQMVLPGFRQPGLVFDVSLHIGTAAAVVALEWRRILEALVGSYFWRLTVQIVMATAATAVIALPLRHVAEGSSRQPLTVGVGLAVTGVLLLLPGRRPSAAADGAASAGWGAALFVGLIQGVAVMPGISRSGSTIVAGLAGRFERRWAADFSFLLSVPAILGAAVVEGWLHRAELAVAPPSLWSAAAVGALVAALTGGVALLAVRHIVEEGRLHLFSYYLLPLSALVIVTALLGMW
jgi:undecaprenyl-diphosphatase